MGKHKNLEQERILVNFMKKHNSLAQGSNKGRIKFKGKQNTELLWQELCKKLNAAGPPYKDRSTWKKALSDWKINIRKKLIHNKMESEASGGGPSNILPISSMEHDIAEVTGIYSAINGIDVKSFSVCKNIEQNENEDQSEGVAEEITIENNSQQFEAAEHTTKHETLQGITQTQNMNYMQKYMQNQEGSLKNISDTLKKLLEISKENGIVIKRTYCAIEKIANVQEKKLQLQQSNNKKLEEELSENNKIKRRLLEIEEVKLKIVERRNFK